MKIAIVGTGNLGSALGRGWAAKDHDIFFAVRDPSHQKYSAILDAIAGHVRLATIADAAEQCDVVVLSSPWPTVPEILRAAGDLTDKVVIDCNNPVNPDLKTLSIGHHISAGELIARWAPGANVVKCFNTVGAARMLDPFIDGVPITMPYCGDDPEAKSIVKSLAADLGFTPIDVGGLSQSRLLEPMAMLWIYLAVHGGWGTDFALQLARATRDRG